MTSQNKRILFFPWGAGGGVGYTGRCLAVAETLRSEGYECFFSSSGATTLIKRAGFVVVQTRVTRPSTGAEIRPPPYLAFANVERVYAITTRYYKKDRLLGQLQEDLRVIEEVQPSLIVTDMQPTAAIAARYCQVPLVSLADADFLSPKPNSWMPWVDPDIVDILPYPSCLPVFNEILVDLGLDKVDNVSELLWGDLTLIPSIPELEPIDAALHKRSELHYVGPIFWDPPWSDTSSVLANHRAEHHHNIYVTVGSGVMCPPAVMQVILDACEQSNWRVFVSTGYAFRGSVSVPPNTILQGFTGLNAALDWADVVISHGGYSTVIASLLFGKPSLIIPFMSEQEANGLYFIEQQGAGLLLRRAFIDRQTKRVRFRLRYSGYSEKASIRVEDVQRALRDVLRDEQYRKSAARIGEKLRQRRASVSLPTLFASLA